MSRAAAPVVHGLPAVGPRLALRSFRLSDFDAVHAWASDPEVTRHLRWGPNRPRETERFLAAAVSGLTTPEPSVFHLAVELRDPLRTVGSLSLTCRRPRLVEVGYCLARAAWGRGMATEALATAIPFARLRFPGAVLFGLVARDNPASGRVLEHCGFARASDPTPFRPWMDGPCSGAFAYRLDPARAPST